MRSGTIVGIILIATVCCSPTLALNTKVYSLSEGNLSIDVGPGFELAQQEVDNSNNGSFNQNLRVINSQTKGLAVIQITNLYDETLKAFDPAAISELWIQGAISSALKDGGKPAGNWSAISSKGMNTTVHTVSLINTSMSYMGETVEIANWIVGKNTHIGIMSFFNKNVTRQIIKTLTIS